MTEPVVKVRRLIALALGSPSIEEARTSALIAVRLIEQHKLLEATPRREVGDMGIGDFMAEMRRQAERVRQNSPRPWTPPAAEPASPAEAPRKHPEPPPGFSWVASLFRDRPCAECDLPIVNGEPAMRERSSGLCWHSQCWREVAK